GVVGRFHRAGIWHADLNAHNVLVSPAGLHLIDFDRGRQRAPAAGWRLANLRRLRRSLLKLGAAAAGLERAGKPLLLIDCGPGTLDRYMAAYDALPAALFITHTHMDHVAELEQLFIRLWFDPARRGRMRLFTHAALVPWLQTRVADYPGALAEGGVNFWEAFQLVPCSRGFWLDGC